MEVIERKGPGHPDTIADNLSEEFANLLAKEYKKVYGEVKHYNVDKVLVACGKTNGMKMTKPVKIVFSGNATYVHGMRKLMKRATEKVLEVEISRGLKYKIVDMVSLCSSDLTDNFTRRKSNDTSFAVGYPMSKNEKLVLSISKTLEKLSKVSAIGTDHKVMYINGKIFIALAFRVRVVYDDLKKELENLLKEEFKVDVEINKADTPESKFVTITGTSLEQGDAGMTGRGNRRNGLITPMKPMTMEAYYGKNNITHIGRIYQDRAQRLANKIKKKVLLVNYIGGNINKPFIFKW